MIGLILNTCRATFCIKSTYTYQLTEDYTCFIAELDEIEVDEPWLKIDKGYVTIPKGYAWNGCTPKLSVLGLFIIGTPDGHIDYKTGKPLAYYASLIHDVLYQYRACEKMRADTILLNRLVEAEFPLAKAYYYAVRWFYFHKYEVGVHYEP